MLFYTKLRNVGTWTETATTVMAINVNNEIFVINVLNLNLLEENIIKFIVPSTWIKLFYCIRDDVKKRVPCNW